MAKKVFDVRDNVDHYNKKQPIPRYDRQTHEPSRSVPHPNQVKMELSDGFSFMADKEMVPLLEGLRDAGIKTYSHCAGHHPENPAWVVLELDGLHIEIRPACVMGNGVVRGPQAVLMWRAPWNKTKGESR